jgi:hypothetical protein
MATQTGKDQAGTAQPEQVTIKEGSFVGPDITSSVSAALSNYRSKYPSGMENVAAALAGLSPRHFPNTNNSVFMQTSQHLQTLTAAAGKLPSTMRQNQPFVLGAMKVAGARAQSSGIINSTVAFGGDSTAAALKDAANYKDYSRMPIERADLDAAPNNGASGKDPSFPVKLHQIISSHDHEEFITWLPHGRSWRVVKPKAFEAKVIPLYFRHAKYASFMRQVNGWGFKRITEGPDQNSYYHEVS